MTSIATDDYVEEVRSNGIQMDEDGFFTCEVSVQHKKNESEMNKSYQTDEMGRRVVWPTNQTVLAKEQMETSKTYRNNMSSLDQRVDQPFSWIKSANNEQQDSTPARARVSRSRSRSRNIAERARSFERGGGEARVESRSGSRAGSLTSRRRSPSDGRQQHMEDLWCHQIDRPSSRTDVDSRRFGEIGRVNTMDWEERIHGSHDNIPAKVMAPKRRETNFMKNGPAAVQDHEQQARCTPDLPPPPARQNLIVSQREETPPFPPPPSTNTDARSKLSEDSVNLISEENKETIIKQWMEGTANRTQDMQKELERFAYDIAESVVDSMEKNSTYKDEDSNKRQSTSATSNEEIGGAGTFHAVPAVTRSLHGPVYVQEQTKWTGMTFQQEERRRQQLRKQEEERQQERRQMALEQEQREKEMELQRLRQAAEEKLRREQQEKLEAERKRLESERLQREQEEKEAMRRLEEENRIRQMNELRMKEEREREKMKAEELKRLELERYEKLRQEEEIKRREEARLESEMRKQYELQMAEMELENKRQENTTSVRSHIPKLDKTKSFENFQDRAESLRYDDHLMKVKTGQVNEKRNFWIRSTSVDRLNQASASPAPRRRRLDGWNMKQKENQDPDSRPGSSLGHAQTGSTRNIASGFLAKSKSSSTISNVHYADERARPRQKMSLKSWTKEKFDQNTNLQKFQDVKTNHVHETINSWGKQEQTASGRATPVPSKHIGQVFEENRIAKAENEKQANAWRQKSSEPSLKIVNVSVEKGAGSGQNVHISENAHMQMANFMTESSTTGMTVAHQKQETMTSCSTSFSQTSQVCNGQQPPPTPERNQSFGGKSSEDISLDFMNQREAPSPLPNSVHLERSEHAFKKSNTVSSSSMTNFCNEMRKKDECGGSVSCQDQNQQPIHHQSTQLQNSFSEQSINSLVSNCSSGALPLPVKQCWYDNIEEQSTASTSTSTLFTRIEPNSSSNNATGRTPIPVAARWYTNKDKSRSLTGSENKQKHNQEERKVQNQEIAAVSHPKVITDQHKSSEINQHRNSTSQFDAKPKLTVQQSFSESQKKQKEVSKIERISKESACKGTNLESVKMADKLVNVPFEQHGKKEECQAARETESRDTQPPEADPGAKFKEEPMSKLEKQTFHNVAQARSSIEELEAKSVNSDNTVIENVNIKELQTHEPNQDDNPQLADLTTENLVITDVPPSPKEIRKKFQVNSAFDKKFTKSCDVELSQEFRQGVRGKVKNLKNIICDQQQENRSHEIRQQRDSELKEIALKRSDSSKQIEEASNERLEIMKQEKNRELDLIRRSRSKSRIRDDIEELGSSYTQEKLERGQELALLSKRSVREWDFGDFKSAAEEKARQLREERERELSEISNRPNVLESSQTEEGQSASHQLALDTVDADTNESHVEIGHFRNVGTDLDDHEMGDMFSGTIEKWKERETAASCASRQEVLLPGPTQPTKKIGSMFNRDPDYWGDETVGGGSDWLAMSPPLPPRQSSRGKVEEYTKLSTATWN